MRKLLWVWLTGFVIAAIVAPTVSVMEFNTDLSRILEPVGRQWPAIQLIWVVGGLPVTTLVVLYFASGRLGRGSRQWSIFWVFVGGSVVELLVKHFVATPFPPNVVPGSPYAQMITWTNIEPSTVFAWLALWSHAPVVRHASVGFLRGTFPSGHVFRITYAYGLLLKNFGFAALVAVAAFAVVATGGHWPWDAVGGFLLGAAGLAAAQKRRRYG